MRLGFTITYVKTRYENMGFIYCPYNYETSSFWTNIDYTYHKTFYMKIMAAGFKGGKVLSKSSNLSSPISFNYELN